MAEYIERDALLWFLDARKRDTCNGTVSCLQMQRMVERIPAADVEPVKHARWIPVERSDVYFACSYCGCGICTSWDYDDLEWNFCPKCGSDMDGGADHAE